MANLDTPPVKIIVRRMCGLYDCYAYVNGERILYQSSQKDTAKRRVCAAVQYAAPGATVEIIDQTETVRT